jgi:hypothetical protein
MTMRVQAVLTLMVGLAMMGLASCGHYTCGATFGSSTCNAGPPGLGGGNGTGSTTAAFAFVANGSASGSIVGYTLNTSVTPPTLTATANYTAPVTPSADAGMGMVVAQKQFLYTAFGSTNQIFGWTISTTGTLTAVSTPVTASFASAGSMVFDTPRVITNPAGTLLFIADEFGNQVFVYQIGTGGVLAAVTGSPFLVPFSPGNMTTDGLGNFLYVTDSSSGHTGSEIAAYSIGTGTGSTLGALTAVSGSPFVGVPFDMWQVKGEPTGKYLIGTKGMSLTVNGSDDNNLYVFSIAQPGAANPGAIALVAPFPTTHSPFSIAVQSNTGGNLIYSFGLDDAGTAFNPAEGYALSTSGALSAVSGSPFSSGAVGDEGQFDQSGGLLFVYGGLVVNNTIAYDLTALDAAGGNLTQPATTLSFGGFWVATDPQ